MEPNSRRLARLLVVAALVAGLASAVASATGTSAGAPKLKVVATDLNNPHQIFLAPSGELYVAEAGTGGTTCAGTCTGLSGSITRIADGRAERVVTGLVSAANGLGREAEGPSDVLFAAGTYYVLLGGMDMDSKRADQPNLAFSGHLISTPAGKVKATTVADFVAFEDAHNPDHGAGPGAKYHQPPLESNPYAFVPFRGGFAVADASANDLLWVDPKGKISVLAVFPTQPEKLSKSDRAQIRAPATLKTLNVQAVPTSVAVGPDGALYVGELTGWPYRVGTAHIWRVVPGKKPSLYASGFTNISDLAFDGKDLLVLEYASKGLLTIDTPGALIRLTPGGKRTVIASDGLVSPTGLAVGKGTIYISNYGTYPGTGAGSHGEIVALPASTGR